MFDIDRRDLMFYLKECPGYQGLQDHYDCDAETLDMVFDQSEQFCKRVLAPIHGEVDRQGCEFKDGRVKAPDGIKALWEQYAQMGVIGMMAEGEFGGTELPHFFSIPVAEMECGSCVSFSVLPMLTRGAADLVASFGSDKLRQVYLEKMYSGQWTGTMCLTEPSAGSDVGASTSRAEPSGDQYKITGTKIFISWGEHDMTENIIHLVLARVPGAPAGTKGLSLFVVPKMRFDEHGNVSGSNDVECVSIEHKMGLNGSPTCVLSFGANNDCYGDLVGREGEGMRLMFQMMNAARIEVGIQGLGQAAAAYRAAVAYSLERRQGSVSTPEGRVQVPLVSHPDIRRMLIKMRALVEGTRALTYHLGYYLDLSIHADEGDRPRYQALVELLTPICKSYGSDQGFRVTEMAVQTFGGYGYCQDYPVEQYMRDSKIASIYEGTNGIQALDLLFRKILGNGGAYLEVWLEIVDRLVGELHADLRTHGKELLDAVAELKQTLASFGAALKTGRHEWVQFHASEFQEHMGHVVVAFYLLKGAQTAASALAQELTEDEQRYYSDKILTTRYFYSWMLPLSMAALRVMRKDSCPGLEMRFG